MLCLFIFTDAYLRTFCASPKSFTWEEKASYLSLISAMWNCMTKEKSRYFSGSSILATEIPHFVANLSYHNSRDQTIWQLIEEIRSAGILDIESVFLFPGVKSTICCRYTKSIWPSLFLSKKKVLCTQKSGTYFAPRYRDSFLLIFFVFLKKCLILLDHRGNQWPIFVID